MPAKARYDAGPTAVPFALPKTAGGHRRIALPEAIRFVRESGSALVRPEILGIAGLPSAAATMFGSQVLAQNLYDALRAGNAPSVNGCVAGLYLNGMAVAAICDGSMQGAMKRIGELWPCDARAILIEHRATGICLHALGMLRQMIGHPPENAPVAMGGAPQGDPYMLPSTMAGTVLAEAGFREMNFGPDTLLELLAIAAREHKAKIVWLAVKAKVDRAKVRVQVTALAEKLAELGTLLVVGGSAVASLGFRPSKSLHIMQNMAELAAFALGAGGHLPEADGHGPETVNGKNRMAFVSSLFYHQNARYADDEHDLVGCYEVNGLARKENTP